MTVEAAPPPQRPGPANPAPVVNPDAVGSPAPPVRRPPPPAARAPTVAKQPEPAGPAPMAVYQLRPRHQSRPRQHRNHRPRPPERQTCRRSPAAPKFAVQEFEEILWIVSNGGEIEEVDAILVFDETSLVLKDEDSNVLRTLPYSSVRKASYSRTQRRIMFVRTTRHQLTLAAGGEEVCTAAARGVLPVDLVPDSEAHGCHGRPVGLPPARIHGGCAWNASLESSQGLH